ncbi:hypothetical protein JKP88DRAFT_300498 [Tribonema minus]|uniref:Uncharacterized protein n=1 Tax=Tribonema minus TaxID=303371 RepID=A0A835ZG70_9STRA|nr:hypothetical protein JKP88DRAFT_300498 [Tribonema minus]
MLLSRTGAVLALLCAKTWTNARADESMWTRGGGTPAVRHAASRPQGQGQPPGAAGLDDNIARAPHQQDYQGSSRPMSSGRYSDAGGGGASSEDRADSRQTPLPPQREARSFPAQQHRFTPLDDVHQHHHMQSPLGTSHRQRMALGELQHHELQHQAHALPGRPGGGAGGTATDPRNSLFMRQISAKGLAMIYFIMVWRLMHHYETADALRRPLARALAIAPSLALLVANAACLALCCLSGATLKHKLRMKLVLTLNSLAEAVLLGVNTWLLVMGPARVPKGEYVSSMLVNVWFLSICHNFAKMHWV